MAKLKHLELPNGNNYDIYGVNVQEISYDDYQALTPEQKNSDIAYCIIGDATYGEASGAIANFSDGSANPLADLKIAINPVQAGSGAPSPTNPRPISGWTGANVTVCGKNLFDNANLEIGNYDNNGSKSANPNMLRTINHIPIKNGTKYIINSTWNSGGSYNGDIFEYDINKNFLRRSFWGATSKTKNFGNDVYYINLTTRQEYGTTPRNDIYILVGEIDSGYIAYDTNSYIVPISWQTEAGTVYGGELDVTSGVLTVKYIRYDLGDYSWVWITDARLEAGGAFRAIPSDMKLSGYILADIYKCYPDTGFTELISRYGASINNVMTSNGNAIYVINSAYTDVDDFKTAMDGKYMLYELATPQTYQLTPTQVSSILGMNNIWADCGGINYLKYIKSIQSYNELRINDNIIASSGFAYHAADADQVNGHTVASDVPSNATFTDTTYTFANGTNGFTVTPSGGTAQTVTVTPSITNNVTGSGTSGYLAKFNGANTITNGAQLGSDTTKFLRNDGTWAVPPGAGGGVTGVKGNAESTYRTGNVNLTPANLGLESKSAASGGTDLSLVTTNEKYVWNNKATTDENVKQTQISTSINNDYPILGGYPYDTSSPHIRGTYYSDDITITGHSLIVGATGASAAGYNSLAIGSGGTYESQLCAGGDNSIAVGEHVCSSAKNQVVFGRWNREDPTVFDTHPMGIRFDHERNSSEGQYVEIVGNGTSYQNTSNARTLDWSGNEWLAGTLTASGATINGSISVSGSISVLENILSDDSSLDITTSAAPSSDYWSLRGIYLRDTNQTEFGRVRGYYLSDGEVGVEYETKRTVGGTVKYNNLNLGIDSSGNNVVSVSSPSAWRTALGLKDWVEVDHKGGTTAIPIPSGTTEICCVITVGNNTIAWTFTLPYAALSSTSWRYTNAYTSVSDGYIAVNVSTAQVSLNAVYNGKSNVTSSSILYLYAR